MKYTRLLQILAAAAFCAGISSCEGGGGTRTRASASGGLNAGGILGASGSTSVGVGASASTSGSRRRSY